MDKTTEQLYEEYAKEINTIYDNWQYSEYLKGFSKENARIVSVILENERLYLETVDSDEFKENALNIMSKSFQDFIGFDLVNFQPALYPTTNIFYYKWTYSGDVDIPASLKLFHDEKSVYTRMINLRQTDGSVDAVANHMNNLITKEIINDIRMNIGTHKAKKVNFEALDFESIYIDLYQIDGIIHKKTLLGSANWIITSVDIAKKLKMNIPDNLDKVKYVGKVMNRCNVYIDPDFKKNELLLGLKPDGNYIKAYTYCPYVTLGALTKEELPYKAIFIRYAKYLPPYAATNYALLTYESE